MVSVSPEAMMPAIWFAASMLMLSPPRYSPTVLMATAIPQQAFETSSRADCCRGIRNWKVNAISCLRSQDHCPSALRVAGTAQAKGVTVTVLNADGQFARGANGFCIQFTDEAGRKLHMAKLHLDVTLRMGRVEAVRAISEITPSGVGLYCAHVVLLIPGRWMLTFKYADSTGHGKLTVLESVT